MKIRAIITMLLISGLLSSASTLITEPFAIAGPDGVPEGWYTTNSAATDIRELNKIPYQRIYRNNAEGGSAAVYYTGSEGEVSNGIMKDFEADFIIRLGGSDHTATFRGVAVRTQSMDLYSSGGSEFWGYTVGLVGVDHATEDRKGLYIYENPTGTGMSVRGDLLAFIALDDPLVLNDDYWLNVTVEGSLISASLYDPSKETLLATVSYNEAKDVAGYFGLLSYNANSKTNTYFKDLSLNVTAVPEPQTAVIISALLLLTGIVWRRNLRFLRR